MSRSLANLVVRVLIITIGFTSVVSAARLRPTEISIAYYSHWPTPNQFSRLKKTYDSALGLKVNWVPFENGGAMSAALNSGKVEIAYSLGFLPFVFGLSGGLDLSMIGIAVAFPGNENCMVRKDAGVSKNNASALEGNRVAVVPGSLTHFKLLKILSYLHVNPQKISIYAVKDGVAAATALRRGDVALACASGDPLQTMAAYGTPLMSGNELAAIGLKAFDIVAVSTRFMNQYPDLVQAFMDVTEASNLQWKANPDPMRAAVARAAGMDRKSSDRALTGFVFPSAAEQKSIDWVSGVIPAYTRDVANFFVGQGQLDHALDSYEQFMTTRFLR